MPECLDAEKLLEVAIEEKVSFVPGHAFFPGGSDGRCCMRLNFSYSPPDIIEEGIRRLGRAIVRMLEEHEQGT
jgi:2-aminoadipate transaminase